MKHPHKGPGIEVALSFKFWFRKNSPTTRNLSKHTKIEICLEYLYQNARAVMIICRHVLQIRTLYNLVSRGFLTLWKWLDSKVEARGLRWKKYRLLNLVIRTVRFQNMPNGKINYKRKNGSSLYVKSEKSYYYYVSFNYFVA